MHRRVGPGIGAGLPLEVGQQQQELVAALARDEVGLAGAVAQALGELGEQLVPGGVAQRVVHELEVVEVQEDHADAEVVPAGAGERVLEHLLEQRPVRQARELVVVGEERDLLLGRLALGDVEDHALDQPGLALLVARSDTPARAPTCTVPSSCTMRYSWFSVVWLL